MDYALKPELTQWLQDHALDLDQSNEQAANVLTQLASAQLFGLGVPTDVGGLPQSRFSDAAWATAEIAKHSLSAAFVMWAQRCFISYILHSPDGRLANHYLPSLLTGSLAGATGLSNAIKYLGGIEQLQIEANPICSETDQWQLSGFLPWVSNLNSKRFVVAVAAQRHNEPPAIFLVHHDDLGLTRNSDLELHSLQASNTASVKIAGCLLTKDRLLAENAADFIQKIRPQFLTLQSALSTGLALRCLEQVLLHPRLSKVNETKALTLKQQVLAVQNELNEKTESGYFVHTPNRLFELRIQLAHLTEQASLLELQSEGGACYLQGQREQTLRRVREALFLPLVSPTIMQLQAQLAPSLTSEALEV